MSIDREELKREHGIDLDMYINVGEVSKNCSRCKGTGTALDTDPPEECDCKHIDVKLEEILNFLKSMED